MGVFNSFSVVLSISRAYGVPFTNLENILSVTGNIWESALNVTDSVSTFSYPLTKTDRPRQSFSSERPTEALVCTVEVRRGSRAAQCTTLTTLRFRVKTRLLVVDPSASEGGVLPGPLVTARGPYQCFTQMEGSLTTVMVRLQ